MVIIGNWLRRISWKTRHFLYRRGLLQRPPEIAPLQWLPKPRQVRLPAELLDGLNETELAYYTRVEQEVLLLSRLLSLFPSKLSLHNWEYLIECTTLKQRLDHLKFLRKVEMERELEAEKRMQKPSKDFAKRLTTEADSSCSWIRLTHFELDLWKRKLQGTRQMISFRLDEHPKLVVDCRYIPMLSPRGANLTAMQLKYLISTNNQFVQPWPLYYVNWEHENKRFTQLEDKHLDSFSTKRVINVVVTSKNYNDLFCTDKIVYLSPDAEEELERVESDEVYVMGGIVDRVLERGIHPNASKESAFSDGVICKKLPLDRHVKWKSGSKFLTLLAVQGILHDVYENNGDWEAALTRHIPVRNTRSADEKNKEARQFQKRVHLLDKMILDEVNRRLS